MEGKDCIVPAPSGDKKPVIDEHLCTGCGICPNRCPFDAIDIINLPEALDKPIHRYGRNGFHLYSLPTPQFGKVIGIVGKNGVGKSTAIKLLAGIIKPNLGTEHDADHNALVSFFKGKEAQHYFEAMRDGKIIVAHKPQHVELIPETTKGTVADLLRKVDERKQLDSVVDHLQLRDVLERDIKHLSGGELQRVAIAATALRKANLYIFDEPTSYLDIKQRINVSKFIRTLATETTAVLVVEHDLIILDYMADLIHIMYGREGAYGIVSLLKPARSAMNTFLEGFIKEENMRFRDHRITFLSRPPPRKIADVTLTQWPTLSYAQGSFTLKATEGILPRNQIIGVVGENGTGKTTFVKILAGITKVDGIDSKLTVAYKPQYLERASDVLVMNVLGPAAQRYDAQLIKPLEIHHLLTKPLNTLSGGELQRVAIAHCLSQEADIYLLDEPSAYLDVEQRLAFSKVVRDVCETRDKTILIVDHDLLFIDYIADKMLVFEGTPAKEGNVTGPYTLEAGMNEFLRSLGITLRRDIESKRPRINKVGSRLDREQKEEGKLYYT